MKAARRGHLAIPLVLLAALLMTWNGCAAPQGQNLFQSAAGQEQEAPGQGEDAETIHILLTHTDCEGSVPDYEAQLFKKSLEHRSGGLFQVEIYPDDSLGNLEDSRGFFSNGAVDMRLGTGRSNVMPIILWLPVLKQTTLTQVERALQPDGALFQLMSQDYVQTDNNCMLLGTFHCMYRTLTSNVPVTGVDDISAIRIRTIDNALEAKAWQALGAETAVYPINKVYLALQQGEIDAQENTWQMVLSRKFYLQQRYFANTNHKFYMDPLYISRSFYEGLSQEQQEMIYQAVEDAQRLMNLDLERFWEEYTRVTQQAGIVMINWTNEERERMREILYPVVWQELCRSYGAAQVQAVLDAVP